LGDFALRVPEGLLVCPFRDSAFLPVLPVRLKELNDFGADYFFLGVGEGLGFGAGGAGLGAATGALGFVAAASRGGGAGSLLGLADGWRGAANWRGAVD